MDREKYIEERTAHHKVVLSAAHAGEGIPEHAIDYWAKQQAETDWKRNRVYDLPVEVSHGNVYTYDRHTPGAHLNFNPGGPMVSIQSLSYEELRELTMAALRFLEASDELPDFAEVRKFFETDEA